MKTLLFLLTFFCSSQTYGWFATGHALTAQLAQDLITPKAKNQISTLLDVVLYFPELSNAEQPNVTPEELSKTLNNIPMAATWADAIKLYKWKDSNLKKNISNMHFLDLDVDLSIQFGHEISEEAILKAMESQGANIISGIQKTIKTITSNNALDTSKALAIRLLIHWLGDLHQPLHVCSPIWETTKYRCICKNILKDEIETYGGNLMYFEESNRPNFLNIVGNNPLKDLEKKEFMELHAYLDGMLGICNQLPETMDSPYCPNGYELWLKNKDEYLNYLSQIAKSLDIQTEFLYPNLIQWAKETALVGCNIVLLQSSFNYEPDFNKKNIEISFKKNIESFETYNDSKIKRQIFMGGLRLGHLLQALFDPTNADENYLNLIEKINSDPEIEPFVF